MHGGPVILIETREIGNGLNTHKGRNVKLEGHSGDRNNLKFEPPFCLKHIYIINLVP